MADRNIAGADVLEPQTQRPFFAVRLAAQLNPGVDEAEVWSAEALPLDEEGVAQEGAPVLARAILFRAHFDTEWFDLLDAHDSDLAEVAEAFYDREAAAQVDEEALFADALVVVHHVEVSPHARGWRISHDLISSVALAFNADILALMPARASWDRDGELQHDHGKEAGLRRHWEKMGFEKVGDGNVLMLPRAAR